MRGGQDEINELAEERKEDWTGPVGGASQGGEAREFKERKMDST